VAFKTIFKHHFLRKANVYLIINPLISILVEMNGYMLFERQITLFRHFILLENGNGNVVMQWESLCKCF